MRHVARIRFIRRINMTSTPITDLTLDTGSSKNVTVVDQSGMPLPNAGIAWASIDIQFNNVLQQLTITDDPVNGGFLFRAITAVSGMMTATHVPSGKKKDLPVTITNPVTSISFLNVT